MLLSHCQYGKKPLLENQNLMTQLMAVPQRPALSCFSLCNWERCYWDCLRMGLNQEIRLGDIWVITCFAVNYMRYKINRIFALLLKQAGILCLYPHSADTNDPLCVRSLHETKKNAKSRKWEEKRNIKSNWLVGWGWHSEVLRKADNSCFVRRINQLQNVLLCSNLPRGQPQIPKSFLIQVCSISKWLHRCWDSTGLDYLSAVISMLDFQGLPFQRPNQRYDINFFQWCSIQGNRRMQINQFYMLKPIFLSCVPGDGKWFFFHTALSFWGMKKKELLLQ